MGKCLVDRLQMALSKALPCRDLHTPEACAGSSRAMARHYCSMKVSYSSRASFFSSNCMATTTVMSSATANPYP